MADEHETDSPVINRELTNNEFPSQNNESLRDRWMPDNEWDSLYAKQKLHDKNVITGLRISAFVASALVLLFLMFMIGWKVIVSFSDIVTVYRSTGKSDILWFYGISLFSLMVVFLTVVLATIHVFAFKKKRTEHNAENLNPFVRAVEQFSNVVSQILEKLNTRD